MVKKEERLNKKKTFTLFKKEKKNLAIEYIFNDFSEQIQIKDLIFIFICCLLLLFSDYIKLLIQMKNEKKGDQLILNEQLNFAELFFIIIFAYFFYKMKFYKHQIFSVLIIIFLGVLRYLIKIYHYYYGLLNATKLLFDLFLQIIVAIFDSIVIIYAKALMEYKYISPYKTCYIFGLINTIIIFVLLIIFSFIKNKNKNWFFSLYYEGNYYLDNLNSIIELYGIKLIGLFFASILYGMLKLIFNLTMSRFTVCHIFLLLQNKEATNNIFEEMTTKKGIIFVSLILNLQFLNYRSIA